MEPVLFQFAFFPQIFSSKTVTPNWISSLCQLCYIVFPLLIWNNMICWAHIDTFKQLFLLFILLFMDTVYLAQILSRVHENFRYFPEIRRGLSLLSSDMCAFSSVLLKKHAFFFAVEGRLISLTFRPTQPAKQGTTFENIHLRENKTLFIVFLRLYPVMCWRWWWLVLLHFLDKDIIMDDPSGVGSKWWLSLQPWR